ncbi:MAG: 30S ribosomal protein S17 [Caldimicrobium sp.]
MGKRKEMIGVVVSDKMDKTVVVMVERLIKHPLYGKYIKKRKKYMAHDEHNSCKIGDKVLIEETRPLSKKKRWRVKEILERAKVFETQAEEVGGEAL